MRVLVYCFTNSGTPVITQVPAFEPAAWVMAVPESQVEWFIEEAAQSPRPECAPLYLLPQMAQLNSHLIEKVS